MKTKKNLQTVQRGADDPRRLGLAGQLKGQHVFVRLDVVDPGRHHGSIPAGRESVRARPGKLSQIPTHSSLETPQL